MTDTSKWAVEWHAEKCEWLQLPKVTLEVKNITIMEPNFLMN